MFKRKVKSIAELLPEFLRKEAPTVEYSLAERGKTLIPALESVYQWADDQMKKENEIQTSDSPS